jgi:mRNA interferase HicA
MIGSEGVMPDMWAFVEEPRQTGPSRCSFRNRLSSTRSVLRLPGLDNRTQVFDIEIVKGSEFLRRAKAVAQRRSQTFERVPERGLGSHGTVYLSRRFTVVKDLKKEIGPGLLAAMCRQLGIRKEDL